MTPSLCAASSARQTCARMLAASAGSSFFFSAKDALQVLAFDVLHGDELDPVGLAQIKNADDVLVRNLPREDQFLLEAPKNFGIGGHVGANHLDGDLAVQLFVVGLVNGTHAALSEQADDFIAAANGSAGTQLNESGGGDDAIGSGHRPAVTAGGQSLVTEGQRRCALFALTPRFPDYRSCILGRPCTSRAGGVNAFIMWPLRRNSNMAKDFCVPIVPCEGRMTQHATNHLRVARVEETQ